MRPNSLSSTRPTLQSVVQILRWFRSGLGGPLPCREMDGAERDCRTRTHPCRRVADRHFPALV